MKGVDRPCSKKHLCRYMAESDFRYSDCVSFGLDDSARTCAHCRCRYNRCNQTPDLHAADCAMRN
jgi:hypothetical protein